jgi:hypothetical protein
VFAYTEFTVHHLAGGDFAVVDRLNLHAGFWNCRVRRLSLSRGSSRKTKARTTPNIYSVSRRR